MPSEPLGHGLASPVVELGDVLFGEQTLDAVLDLVVSLACSGVTRADWVSVSLVSKAVPDRFETRSATSEGVRDVDATQYSTGQGPCVEAIRTGQNVHVVLNEEVQRWPDFVRDATEMGAASVLSTPLYARESVIGSLNIYSSEASPFGADDQELALAFAGHASVVLANAAAFMTRDLVNHQLQEALASRDLIGQAKGILMARKGCSSDEAFDVLRRASQRVNRKLRDVAQDVVDGTVAQSSPS